VSQDEAARHRAAARRREWPPWRNRWSGSAHNIDGKFYVTDDECTHAAASLADGMLEGDVIECSMHFGAFHVPTGKVMQPPCELALRTYKVVLQGDDIFVDLERDAAGEPA
jgi:nitrite reductase/ring-hydroxylating ferredoxin subunit